MDPSWVGGSWYIFKVTKTNKCPKWPKVSVPSEPTPRQPGGVQRADVAEKKEQVHSPRKTWMCSSGDYFTDGDPTG